MHVKCIRLDETRSHMFTEGETYQARVIGRVIEVIDNYGYARFILPDSLRFIVQNDGTLTRPDRTRFAYFEIVEEA